MPSCSAINCKNRSETEGIKLFAFPSGSRQIERRNKWMQNIRRANWTPTKDARVCQIHFEESQFELHRADGLKKLKPNAVPTLFDIPNPLLMLNPPPRKSAYKEEVKREIEISTPYPVMEEVEDYAESADVVVKEEEEKEEEDYAESAGAVVKEEEEEEEEEDEIKPPVAVFLFPIKAEQEEFQLEEDPLDVSGYRDSKEKGHRVSSSSGVNVDSEKSNEAGAPSSPAAPPEGAGLLRTPLPETADESPASRKQKMCEYCGDVFVSSSSLSRHIHKHTGEKPFKCQLCDAAFSQKPDLCSHARVHTGERPFKCEFCSYSSCFQGNLASHMRSHTGEKPFKCEACDAAFTQKRSLRTHSRTHTGERPFRCDFCAYAARSADTLAAHVRRHTGERPYVCARCGAAFAQRSSLRQHAPKHERSV